MARIVSSEVIVPKLLSPSEKGRITDALYAVQAEVFDGVDKSAFAKYVIDSNAEQTAILLHRGEAGQIVGYMAFHIFERQLRGTLTAVFRAEAGILRAYRGRNSSVSFGVKQITEYLVRHPGRPAFYLGSLVHPSSYSLFVKYGELVWPNAEQPVPPDIERFMCELADEFGIPAVSGRSPLVRDVGWITRETDVERRYWRHCDRPAARFFVSRNPGYAEGHGLVTLVPLKLPSMLRTAGRMAKARAELWLDSAMILAHRLPIGAQLLRPAEIRKQLSTVKLFAELSPASLDTLVATAEVVGAGPGTFIIREGEQDHDMYVLVRGAVYVLSGPRGEEVVIDEMDRGAVFGEIAMLSGSTRTASIRTATPATLVRVRRDALFPLMEREPALRDAIWKAFAERVFDDFIRSSGKYEPLDREARTAWIGRGKHIEIPAGTAATFDGNAFVFVLCGAVQMEQNDLWSATQAPLLVDGAKPVKIQARSDVRVVLVPPLLVA